MSRTRTWTDDDLTQAVKGNKTIAGVLRALGLSTSPGHYRTLHTHIRRLKLDTRHFKGKGHGTSNPGRPLEEILVENSTYMKSSHLRSRVLKAGLFKEQCSICGQGPEWQGRPIVLELDHINGDPTDNRLDNLRILCPNCHSQTTTFRGRNTPGRYSKRCIDCGAKVYRKAKRCKACNKEHLREVSSRPKRTWPPVEELLEELRYNTYRSIADRLGVSDTGLRKYIARASK